MAGVRLSAICEANEARHKELFDEFGANVYNDIEGMLKAKQEIEAVSITMPDNMHVGAVELAVKYGKHILLEKPIAKNLEDGKRILNLVKNYDKVFTVGHLLRFDPRFNGLKEALDMGDLGEIIHITCRRNSPIVGPRRYIGQSDLSMHVMIHDIDYINWFLKCKPVKVFAKARSILLRENNMNDVIYAIITYENGVIVCMEASWVLPELSPTIIDDQLQLVGTKGVAYIDSCDKGLRFTTDKRSLYPDSRHWPYVNGVPSGDLQAEISGFISAVINNAVPMCSAEEAYRALIVVDAVERSIKEKKEVEIKA